jgi:hypothetical protein
MSKFHWDSGCQLKILACGPVRQGPLPLLFRAEARDHSIFALEVATSVLTNFVTDKFSDFELLELSKAGRTIVAFRV